MLRLALLLFNLVATVFAGIAVVVVLSVPSWSLQANLFIPWAVAASVALAIPVTFLLARRMTATTRG